MGKHASAKTVMEWMGVSSLALVQRYMRPTLADHVAAVEAMAKATSGKSRKEMA